MCGVHFCFKYFIQILYFCGEKVKCGSSTSPELEAGQLWCVYLQQTHSRAPHSTNQTCRAVKKDVSNLNRDTCLQRSSLIANGQDLADFADHHLNFRLFARSRSQKATLQRIVLTIIKH